MIPGDTKVWIVWTIKNGNNSEAELILNDLMEDAKNTIDPCNYLIKRIWYEKDEEQINDINNKSP